MRRRGRGTGVAQANRQRPRRIPAGMMGRCFNCLERGHLRAVCREPTRCLCCGKPGHRSFECKYSSRYRSTTGQERRRAAHEFAPRRNGNQAAGTHEPSAQPPNESVASGQLSRRRRHRGRRGGRRNRRKHNEESEDDGNRPPEHPDPSTPSSPRSPTRRWNDLSEICFIERTQDTEQWEANYAYLAALLQITGIRPEVTPEQALAAVAAQFGFQIDDRFRIHRATPPYDFLLIVPDHGMLLAMLGGDRTVHAPAFQLKIRPWNRLVNAEPGALYHKVDIELEGIRPHVWEYSTAADLL